MRATVDEQVDSWQLNQDQDSAGDGFSNGNSDPEGTAGVGKHPRIGIGLPMSYIYAT